MAALTNVLSLSLSLTVSDATHSNKLPELDKLAAISALRVDGSAPSGSVISNSSLNKINQGSFAAMAIVAGNRSMEYEAEAARRYTLKDSFVTATEFGTHIERASVGIPQVEKTVTLAGDPKVGIVDHYRQIHLVGSIRHTDPASVELTAASQLAILKELIKEGYKVVAQEGIEETITPDHAKRRELVCQDRVKKAFPGGVIPNTLSDFQKRELADIGASFVYAVLKPDTTILRTTTPQDEDRYEKIQRDPSLTEEQKYRARMDGREGIVMREVSTFLSKIPGSKVALIYGDSHKFDRLDVPTNEQLPLITETAFPSVDLIAPVLHTLKDKALQLEVAKRAQYINWSSFIHDQSEELQLTILSRLSGQAYAFRDVTEFKSFLIERAATSAVKDAIIAKFNSGAALFAELNPRQSNDWGDWRNVSRLPSAALSDHVISEYHAATQYELIKRGKAIEAYAFMDIMTPHAQLRALEKLHVVPGEFPAQSQKELREHLLYNAADGAVKDKIIQYWNTKSGPFKAFKNGLVR